MPTCEEVARTIASAELATAGWRRRLSVRLHLLMCRHCRRYFRQMREIGTAARRIFD
jgi:predicted anti-sigma-YlaC factor YlaD